MKRKDFFSLGLKWIGLYGLAVAVEVLFGFSYQEFVRGRELTRTDGIFQVSQWVSLLEPVVLSLVSLCLIKKSSYVEDLVCREDADALIDLNGFFEPAIKLYGTYLVVVSIPNCLGLLANLIIVFYAPSYLSISSESEIIRSHGTSILVTVALGLWCVFREKSITRLVFDNFTSQLQSSYGEGQMDTKQSFQVGVKLIGLYYMIYALPVLFGLVLSILAMAGGAVGASDILGFPFVPALLGPVILFAVGIYVLRDGALFQRLAYAPDDSDQPEWMADYFALGVKLLGFYLILANIPALSQTLSNYLFVVTTNYPTGVGIAGGLGMRTDFLTHLILIMFGFLLLVRVKHLTRWAFPPIQRTDSADC